MLDFGIMSCYSILWRHFKYRSFFQIQRAYEQSKQIYVVSCSDEAKMALRGLLAEIRSQQHPTVRLHCRRVASSKSSTPDSSEFRVPVPWGFIAGQGIVIFCLILWCCDLRIDGFHDYYEPRPGSYNLRSIKDFWVNWHRVRNGAGCRQRRQRSLLG